MESLTPNISETDIEIGHEYALDKHGVDLSRDMLRRLYAKTLDARDVRRLSFFKAMSIVLQRELSEPDKRSQQKMKAIRSALAKMANYRRQKQDKPAKRPHPRSELERIKDRVVLGPDNRQYQMILS